MVRTGAGSKRISLAWTHSKRIFLPYSMRGSVIGSTGENEKRGSYKDVEVYMLRTLLGKRPRDREAPRIAKLQRGIPYDPALINALTHQHRELVMLLVKASSAAEQCYYAEATEALAQFKANLARHLKHEESQLYPYLSHHLWGEGSAELVREMHENSGLIEHTVQRFVDSYLHEPVNHDTLYDFLIDVERVCEEFSREVGREEMAFYTLYMGPEAY